MDEFIAWDERYKRFINKVNRLAINTNGELISIGADVGDIERFSIFRPIGKTDIDGNKIYADCSIVELEYVDNKLQNSHHVLGYFYFNKTELKYWFKVLKCDTLKYDHIGFVNSRFNHLKVIGTLQENPELLS